MWTYPLLTAGSVKAGGGSGGGRFPQAGGVVQWDRLPCSWVLAQGGGRRMETRVKMSGQAGAVPHAPWRCQAVGLGMWRLVLTEDESPCVGLRSPGVRAHGKEVWQELLGKHAGKGAVGPAGKVTAGSGGCPWGVGCKGRALPMAGTGQSRASMRVFCAGRRDGPPSLPSAPSSPEVTSQCL